MKRFQTSIDSDIANCEFFVDWEVTACVDHKSKNSSR